MRFVNVFGGIDSEVYVDSETIDDRRDLEFSVVSQARNNGSSDVCLVVQ